MPTVCFEFVFVFFSTNVWFLYLSTHNTLQTLHLKGVGSQGTKGLGHMQVAHA